MTNRRVTSEFPISLFATPNPQHQEMFYTVPRAGHLLGGIDHHVSRDHFPGHELIYCLNGNGYVRVGGRVHPVGAGSLVWINCHHPHEHGALENDPWEVLWIRVEGPKLATMCEILSVHTNPVVGQFPRRMMTPVYRTIFEALPDESTAGAARIHAAVARLVALVFGRRPGVPVRAERVPPVLLRAVERMKLFYFERFTVAQLAGLCGMSPSHFAHAFKRAFGTGPIDWLRRERINQAKRRLVGTQDRIEEIALQVGYSDRFFFSKDFKNYTGPSPRESRVLEGK